MIFYIVVQSKELKEHADLIVKAAVKGTCLGRWGSYNGGTEYVVEINKCYIMVKPKNTIIVNNLGGTILASKYLEKTERSKNG